jgi:hypothetical protein
MDSQNTARQLATKAFIDLKKSSRGRRKFVLIKSINSALDLRVVFVEDIIVKGMTRKIAFSTQCSVRTNKPRISCGRYLKTKYWLLVVAL